MGARDHNYGSAEWLERQFRQSDHDPWGHHWRAVERYRYEVILGLIHGALSANEHAKPDRALDIGCSTGHFTALLSTVVPAVTGIDISPTAVARARRTFPGLSFEMVDFPAMPLEPSTYDIVTCLEMLYYLDDAGKRRALHAIDELLRPSGLVVFSSKIGGFPYFSPEALRRLVLEVFDIEVVHLCGSSPFARVEKTLFDLHVRFMKLSALFVDSRAGPAVALGTGALKTFRSVQRIPGGRLAACRALVLSSALIQSGLALRAPAVLADWAAARSRLHRTHTVVVGRKRM